jgi:phytoene/squalene synthetase
MRFIDAHETLLDDVPFADDQALRAHFAATEGVLLACACRVLRPGFEVMDTPHPEDYVAAWNAYGLARLLAELPVTLAAGRVLIPRDRLTANHLDAKTVAAAAAANSRQWQALTADLCQEARGYHRHSNATLAAMPRSHRAALYHLALVEPYLQASEMALSVAMPVQPWTRVWRLLRVRWTGRLGVQLTTAAGPATEPKAVTPDAMKSGQS